jgi:hypothetical protein
MLLVVARKAIIPRNSASIPIFKEGTRASYSRPAAIAIVSDVEG